MPFSARCCTRIISAANLPTVARSVLSTTTALLFLLALQPLAHAKRDAIVNQAALYLRNGQPQLAFELLAPLEVERAGDPDFDLALGIAASQTQRYTLAIMALERAVQQQPQNARAKTELASAYYAVRDSSRAAELFRQAQQAGVPSSVSEAIDQLMTAMQAPQTKPKPFRLNQSVHLTVGRDSNVNRAPSQNRFQLPGYAFALPLSEESRKVRSNYASLGYTANANYAFHQNWAWLGSAQLNTRSNHRASRLNTQSLHLSSGILYSRERHETGLLFHTSLQSLRGRKAAAGKGISSYWTYHLDGYRQFSVGLGYSHEQNHLSRYSSKYRTSLNANYAHQLRAGTFLFAGIGYTAEKPEQRRLADQNIRSWSISMGARYHILHNLSLTGNLAYEYRSHSGKDPTFLKQRIDREYRLQTTMDWVVHPRLTLSPALGAARSNSSIDFYSYRRNHLSVSARYRF